jgi:hypothetical protein
MSKRKPLPYAAGQQIDAALMELADLQRAALALVNGREVSPEERMRRLAQIVDHAHRAAEELREVRRMKAEG